MQPWLGSALPAMLLAAVLAGVHGRPASAQDCTARSLPGEIVCVCREPAEARLGSPPERRLLLDGRPSGALVAATDRALFYRLPDQVPLGEHELGLATPHGSAAGGGTRPCRLEVIRIHARLDRERIWRGQGTPVSIEIEGSREPMRIRLLNESPATITIEGGADQILTTAGGVDNVVERQVLGVRRGEFSIRYELLDAACPCDDFPGDGVFSEESPAEVSDPSVGETTFGEATDPVSHEPQPTEEAPPTGEPTPTIPGSPPTAPEATEPVPHEPQPTEGAPPTGERSPTIPVTGPPPTAPPPETCASIGEEIERLRERYVTLTEEIELEPIPRPTVTTPGPTGHPYCDLTYTTWARGAQVVSIHRLMTEVKDLADFCLGHGTCTAEGHRGYLAELSGLATTLQGDARVTVLVREMPPLVASLLREYRFELGQLEQARRQLEDAVPASADATPEHAYRLRQAAERAQSFERQIGHMEQWLGWSRALVSALDSGSLLSPPPAASREETTP